jgi:uncharacterized membrane protein
MKKYFITGLIFLLPLAVTLGIAIFIVNLFTAPFVGIVKNIFQRYGLLDTGFLFLSAEQTQVLVSQVVIIVLLFFFTVLLGALTRWFFIHYLIRIGDYILLRIPVVSSVYKTSQDVIRTVFTTSKKSFKQVVLVPFPNATSYSVGLVTQEQVFPTKDEHSKSLVAVFVPTTPNPTSGFLILFNPEDIIYVKMSVEEAFKYVISCGIIAEQFQVISKEEAIESESIEAND